MAKILLLQGPNLNLLGQREPEIYGSQTLEQIHARLTKMADTAGVELVCIQSNAEHVFIDTIQVARQQDVDMMIINPAAWGHTSIALRDALLASNLPFIEVHLSNIYAREPFRHHSYLNDIAKGVICGLGAQGYDLALAAALHYLNKDMTWTFVK